jgi:hypothetical protein
MSRPAEEPTYKRVNITLRADHYAAIAERDLNLSGLIRDLLGDYLSASTVTLQVSPETRAIYDTVVANTGASDADLEVFFRDALISALESRIGAMQELHKRLLKKKR